MTEPQRNQGERNGLAKLTAHKVREIRARFAKGEKSADLCFEYDVSESNIRLVVARQTWAHVDG